jgi:hypothetical protein
MKTKLLVSLLTVFVISLFANTKEDDLMNIRINENVILKNGFGAISGKPILNDKSLEDKIILRGQFNVSKNNNAVFEFDKVEVGGKIYNLNNVFQKKGRLKSADITLQKDSNLTVSGGNKDEILGILNASNQKVIKDNKENDTNTKQGSNQNYSPSNSGYSPSSLSDLAKSTDPTTSSNGSSTPTTTSDTTNSAVVVDCPKATYTDGVAKFYVPIGQTCIPRSTISVETKYNNKSCLNKVDYKNNTIELGYELYANDAEYGSVLVQSCQYKDPIPLNSEVSSCKPTVDYTNKTAELQKRFFYNYENTKTYVGECTPSSEVVPIDYDINSCPDDRHDFENKVSIAQGQYFYMYENKRNDVGQCVDIPKYTYTHYQDSTTCKPKTVGTKIFWEERVAYNDLIGTQKFATDCAVIDPQGEQLQTELSGYTYNDNSKQAIRRENTFFINPLTNEKIYVDQNVETANAFPYVETQCDLVNDDATKTTTLTTKLTFDDTIENKTVTIHDCQVKSVTPYTLVGGGTETYQGSLGFQRLKKVGAVYSFYADDSKVIDITSGTFPILKSGTTNITSTSCVMGSPYDLAYSSVGVSYGTCVGGDIINSGATKTCSLTTASGGEGSLMTNTRYFSYTNKSCKAWDYYEEIGKYSVASEYLRGDGTSFVVDDGLKYKVIR